jgi:uncharacterized membrane protein YfcA
MSVRSLLGAVVGGMLGGIIPVAALKIGLGLILSVSAVRMFHGGHATAPLKSGRNDFATSIKTDDEPGRRGPVCLHYRGV